LGFPTPGYAHLPVAVNAAGEKLSKQTLAMPLDIEHPVPALHQALCFLGQDAPAGLAAGSLSELWQWARTHWRLANTPSRRHQPVTPQAFPAPG
jgi:glutamyl-Q tRNA(Asp) synthetase